MRSWLVVHRGKQIDTVFFNHDCDREYVRKSLINHDGYPMDIEVFRG